MFPKWFRRLKRRRQTKGRCAYCGCRLSAKTATRDHIVPRSKGGTGRKRNIAIVCLTCNKNKRDMMPDDWMRSQWRPRRTTPRRTR